MIKKLLKGFSFWLSISLLLVASNNTAANVLQTIQFTSNGSLGKIALGVSGALSYHSFNLNRPDRLVIDLPNTYSTTRLEQLQYSKKWISTVRASSDNTHKLRLVFELPPAVKTRVYPDANRHRLIAEFSGGGGMNTEITPVINTPRVSSSQNNPQPIMTAPKERMRDVVVTIDPGHGGKDPGAMGANGTREKNIVLAISQELADQINQEPGMRAVLTRGGDYYIGLRQRLTAARKHNADLFIAIHADAYNKRDSSGASVFALSPHGASSEAARWLAERENHSELGDVTLTDKSLMLRSVLLDLSQTATIVDSLNLGDQALGNLKQMTRLHNQKVEQAQFVVLKSPDIPSILVETGFITNPDEEQKLSDPTYRANLAKAITQGIKAYFTARPPSGTIFSTNKEDA